MQIHMLLLANFRRFWWLVHKNGEKRIWVKES